METIKAFGCIPFKKEEYGAMVLMVENCAGNNHWEFPKGKQEEGEDGKTTALRELKEETNLTGNIVDIEPIEISFEYEENGTMLQKVVSFYFCEILDDSTLEIRGDELVDFLWLGLDEIENKATYPSMKEVARKACEHLSR